MKTFLYACIFFLLIQTTVWPLSLKEKIEKGHPGDYIVTEKENHFSILILRSQSESLLVLEEISIPTAVFESLEIPTWRKWVESGAPGHTSWILFEINLNKGKLQESYSWDQRRWLSWDDSEPFLSGALFLPLEKMAPHQRKRVGVAPLAGEEERRAIWNPAVVRESKKTSKPQCEVFHAVWPEDQSRLSKSSVDFYFDRQQPDFPFPFWIEVYNGHYSFKLPIIDSGSQLFSTFRGTMPHRLPFLTHPAQLTNEGLIFHLKSPTYYDSFHLFALDVTEIPFQSIEVPCHIEKTNEKEEIKLIVYRENLTSLLRKDHTYRWSFIPENFADVYTETEDLWIWKE